MKGFWCPFVLLLPLELQMWLLQWERNDTHRLYRTHRFFPSEMLFLLCNYQCDANNSSECALYTFSSGVNAIQEWYKLHYMNIMAQIPLETKEELSYSADDLLLTCFFDGLSCDKRSVHRKYLPAYRFISKYVIRRNLIFGVCWIPARTSSIFKWKQTFMS